jgi:hypothetical protein
MAVTGGDDALSKCSPSLLPRSYCTSQPQHMRTAHRTGRQASAALHPRHERNKIKE